MFNERVIEQQYTRHVRQTTETQNKERSPLVKNGRAIIRAENGLYKGEINGGEVIAISNDIDAVVKRLKRADKDVKIKVRYDNRNFSVDGYKRTKLPRIYRLAYSRAGNHGLIIAVDWYKDEVYSQPRLFYDVDDVIKHIRKKNQNYFVFGRQPVEDFRERVGGIKALEVPQELRNIKHLQHVIRRRQEAGSHEAFIEQQKEEQRKMKMIEIYGSFENIGGQGEQEREGATG